MFWEARVVTVLSLTGSDTAEGEISACRRDVPHRTEGHCGGVCRRLTLVQMKPLARRRPKTIESQTASISQGP